MTTKINPCSVTGSVAKLQSRHELAKRAPVEIDDSNENDVRVVASEGDGAGPWVRAKNADEAVAAWNAANPIK